MVSKYELNQPPFKVPGEMVKAFRIITQDSTGKWKEAHVETNNHQRLVWIPLEGEIKALRLIPEKTWGNKAFRVFAVDIYPAN